MNDPPTSAPTVTAIVPVYNGADSVSVAVKSLLNQEFDTLEVLAIDDGSRDASRAVLRDLERANPRLRLVEQDGNRGLAHTLNVGLGVPGGRYVLILHQDCALRGSDWIQRAIRLLNTSGAAGVAGIPYHDVERMAALERIFWVVRAHTGAAPGSAASPRWTLFSENKCDLFLREALLEVHGFDESFRTGGEDQMLALRLEEAGRRVVSDPSLRFDLTLGSDRFLGAGLRKELRYGEQMRTLLGRSRGRAARRSPEGGIDPRLANRAVGVGWVVASLALAVVAIVLRSWIVAALLLLPPAGRAVQLWVRGIRERRAYLLRGRDIAAVGALGVLLDVVYAIGLVTPAPGRRPATVPPGAPTPSGREREADTARSTSPESR